MNKLEGQVSLEHFCQTEFGGVFTAKISVALEGWFFYARLFATLFDCGMTIVRKHETLHITNSNLYVLNVQQLLPFCSVPLLVLVLVLLFPTG